MPELRREYLRLSASAISNPVLVREGYRLDPGFPGPIQHIRRENSPGRTETLQGVHGRAHQGDSGSKAFKRFRRGEGRTGQTGELEGTVSGCMADQEGTHKNLERMALKAVRMNEQEIMDWFLRELCVIVDSALPAVIGQSDDSLPNLPALKANPLSYNILI